MSAPGRYKGVSEHYKALSEGYKASSEHYIAISVCRNVNSALRK
jgi:hypothetical protein